MLKLKNRLCTLIAMAGVAEMYARDIFEFTCLNGVAGVSIAKSNKSRVPSFAEAAIRVAADNSSSAHVALRCMKNKLEGAMEQVADKYKSGFAVVAQSVQASMEIDTESRYADPYAKEDARSAVLQVGESTGQLMQQGGKALPVKLDGAEKLSGVSLDLEAENYAKQYAGMYDQFLGGGRGYDSALKRFYSDPDKYATPGSALLYFRSMHKNCIAPLLENMYKKGFDKERTEKALAGAIRLSLAEHDVSPEVAAKVMAVVDEFSALGWLGTGVAQVRHKLVGLGDFWMNGKEGVCSGAWGFLGKVLMSMLPIVFLLMVDLSYVGQTHPWLYPVALIALGLLGPLSEKGSTGEASMAGTLASHFIAGAITLIAGEALKQFVMGGLHVGGGRDSLMQNITSIGYSLSQADNPSPIEHMLGGGSQR